MVVQSRYNAQLLCSRSTETLHFCMMFAKVLDQTVSPIELSPRTKGTHGDTKSFTSILLHLFHGRLDFGLEKIPEFDAHDHLAFISRTKVFRGSCRSLAR